MMIKTTAANNLSPGINYMVSSEAHKAFLVALLVAHFCSRISDILLVYLYISSGAALYTLLTCSVIVAPLLVVHRISYDWLQLDEKTNPSNKLMHFCQLGLLHRTMALYSGYHKYLASDQLWTYQTYLTEFSDLAHLQFLLACIQAAPQLVIQLFVVASESQWHLLQGVSVAVCITSLLCTTVLFAWLANSVCVEPTKPVSGGQQQPQCTTHWTGMSLQTTWQLCWLAARVSALLSLLLLFPVYAAPLMLARCAVLTLLQLHLADEDLPNSRFSSRVVRHGSVAAAHGFTGVFLQAGVDWRRLAVAHCVTAAENVTMATLFYLYWTGGGGLVLAVLLPLLVASTTLVGIAALLLSLIRCHANRSVTSPDDVFITSLAFHKVLCSAGMAGFDCITPDVTPQRGAVTSQTSPVTSCLTSRTDPVTSCLTSRHGFLSASELLSLAAGRVRPPPAADVGDDDGSQRQSTHIPCSDSGSVVECCAMPFTEEQGRVSDIPELDYVSEGDVTLPNQSAVTAADDNQSAISNDSLCANHSCAAASSVAAPDYENMCPRNAHHGPLAVRSWRTYSDILDSAHETSVAQRTSANFGRRSPQSSTASRDVTASALRRHTYENTDNVQLMIEYLNEEEAGGQRQQQGQDVSSLVVTIEALSELPPSAATTPRRCQSSDDLSKASCSQKASKRRLNTSFDTAQLLVRAPPPTVVDYALKSHRPSVADTSASVRPHHRPPLTQRRVGCGFGQARCYNVTQPNANRRINGDRMCYTRPIRKPNSNDKENLAPYIPEPPSPCYL